MVFVKMKNINLYHFLGVVSPTPTFFKIIFAFPTLFFGLEVF
jgi:hypothetical protein